MAAPGADVLALLRRRPYLAVGAGVGVLIAARVLARDPGDEPAVAADGSTGVVDDGGYGFPGILGAGSSGSLGDTYAPGLGGAPWPGDTGQIIVDPPIVTPPIVTPPPTTTPPPPPGPTTPPPPTPTAWWPAYMGTPPASAIGAIAVDAGTRFGTYRVSGTTAITIDTRTTAGGFSAWIDRRGTYTVLASGSRIDMVRLSSGLLAGRWIAQRTGRVYWKG